MSTITDVFAHEVLDSRGNPTVEVLVKTKTSQGSAIVPSGASTGTYEALELRDGDKNRYKGKGVLKACENVNKIIAKAVKGLNVDDQRGIDNLMIELDGTENKNVLGANAILGVSMACARAYANKNGQELFESINPNSCVLPTPMMNIMNGGQHADSGFDIQEFMIVPVGANSFREALRTGTEIFHTLKEILQNDGFSTSVGDEGGFAPRLKQQEDAISYILKAIEKAGYTAGDDVFLALDSASSEFYDSSTGKYKIKIKGELNELTPKELISFWEDWCKKYPIISIEDGLFEDDFESWAEMTSVLGDKIQIVGDDLLVTNKKRLEKAIELQSANSILIKMNQIGTISETIDTINTAKNANFTNIVSHRSGETEDTTLADLSVAMETGQIKTGSLSRSDRTAKYNQLLRIENYLGEKAVYLGKKAFSNLQI